MSESRGKAFNSIKGRKSHFSVNSHILLALGYQTEILATVGLTVTESTISTSSTHSSDLALLLDNSHFDELTIRANKGKRVEKYLSPTKQEP